jgi:hypothetical protein
MIPVVFLGALLCHHTNFLRHAKAHYPDRPLNNMLYKALDLYEYQPYQ